MIPLKEINKQYYEKEICLWKKYNLLNEKEEYVNKIFDYFDKKYNILNWICKNSYEFSYIFDNYELKNNLLAVWWYDNYLTIKCIIYDWKKEIIDLRNKIDTSNSPWNVSFEIKKEK